MNRHVLLAVLVLMMPGFARAQDDPGEKKGPAVVELFEDGAEIFIQQLHNHGAKDASQVERSDDAPFSGASSLLVTPFQRFATTMPGWNFEIAKDPELGQYRFLRFAWKRTLAPGIMLQLYAKPKSWHRYYAGTMSEKTQTWGAMTRVAADVPRQWELVTRDLVADFGPMTLTGISFTALEGGGAAYFDHIYLGRTIEDLDRMTAAKKNGVIEPLPFAEPELPAANPRLVWLIVAFVLISFPIFLGLAFVLWRRTVNA